MYSIYQKEWANTYETTSSEVNRTSNELSRVQMRGMMNHKYEENGRINSV